MCIHPPHTHTHTPPRTHTHICVHTHTHTHTHATIPTTHTHTHTHIHNKGEWTDKVMGGQMSNLPYRCRCRWTDRQKPDRLTEQQMTDSDWPTHRCMEQQMTDWLTDRQMDNKGPTGWQTDRWTTKDRLADRLTNKDRNMTYRKKYDLQKEIWPIRSVFYSRLTSEIPLCQARELEKTLWQHWPKWVPHNFNKP